MDRSEAAKVAREAQLERKQKAAETMRAKQNAPGDAEPSTSTATPSTPHVEDRVKMKPSESGKLGREAQLERKRKAQEARQKAAETMRAKQNAPGDAEPSTSTATPSTPHVEDLVKMDRSQVAKMGRAAQLERKRKQDEARQKAAAARHFM